MTEDHQSPFDSTLDMQIPMVTEQTPSTQFQSFQDQVVAIHGIRQPNKRWTPDEDQRLLSAVEQFGVGNWVSVAEIVGNGRTKAQCSQRWARCLNPNIKKTNWTKDEELRLISLVNEYGDKAWTRISQEMQDRCDVQCRFRYKFLQKKAREAGYSEIQPVSPEILAPPQTIDSGII